VTTRPAAPTARRRLGAAAATLVIASGLGACQVASPVTTDLSYDPADGLSLTVGEVEILDLLVVSTGVGEVGVVSGYAVNRSSEPANLEIVLSAEDGTEVALEPAVEVPAGSSVRIDGYDPATGEFTDPVVVPEVPVRAGQLITLQVSTEGAVASNRVPILLPEPPYAVYDEVLDSQ
jgi:hypothetical protein